jgi:hypothetical protein
VSPDSKHINPGCIKNAKPEQTRSQRISTTNKPLLLFLKFVSYRSPGRLRRTGDLAVREAIAHGDGRENYKKNDKVNLTPKRGLNSGKFFTNCSKYKVSRNLQTAKTDEIGKELARTE